MEDYRQIGCASGEIPAYLELIAVPCCSAGGAMADGTGVAITDGTGGAILMDKRFIMQG